MQEYGYKKLPQSVASKLEPLAAAFGMSEETVRNVLITENLADNEEALKKALVALSAYTGKKEEEDVPLFRNSLRDCEKICGANGAGVCEKPAGVYKPECKACVVCHVSDAADAHGVARAFSFVVHIKQAADAAAAK